MEIIKIVSGNLDNNTYVCFEGGKAVIIDAACPLEQILKHLQGKTVVGVIITHAHYDHVVHLEEYVRYFGCKCYMSSCAIENIKNPHNNESLIFNKIFISSLKDENIQEVYDGDNLNLLSIPIKIIYTPGHTNCGISIIIDKNIFTGDTLFKNAIGRYDLATSDKRELLKSLKKLYTYEGYNVYPGHGDTTTITKEKV